ncbi:MAG: hypothetical protein EBT18_05060 [Gammaproteobacteria bacterium]|nr:hypothetical protein [Gammaproteobacteria bacterium]
MKVLFFLFVAANVALYVWATQATPKAESGLPQPRVGHNLSRMTLDSEQFGEASKPTNCLRIGPFSTQQTLVDGRRMLVNRGYGLAQQRTTAREVHSHQVLAGPFLSDIARDNARIKLQDSEIRSENIARGDQKFLFLREFAAEEQASNYQTEINALGLETMIEKHIRSLGPLHWLDVPDVVTEERRQQLKALQWGDAMTRLTPIPCPAAT